MVLVQVMFLPSRVEAKLRWVRPPRSFWASITATLRPLRARLRACKLEGGVHVWASVSGS